MIRTQAPILEVATSVINGNNEATAYPWWAIITRRNDPTGIVGPFFSRQDAEDCRQARVHEYGERSCVFCFSGYRSYKYRNAVDEAICVLAPIKIPGPLAAIDSPEAKKALAECLDANEEEPDQ